MGAPGVPLKFSPYQFPPSSRQWKSLFPHFESLGLLTRLCGACDQLFNTSSCTLVVIIFGFWCLYAQRGNGFWWPRLACRGRLWSLFFYSTSRSNFWMRERRDCCSLLQACAIRYWFTTNWNRFWCFLFFYSWKAKLGFFIAAGVRCSGAAGVVFADVSLGRGCSCLYPGWGLYKLRYPVFFRSSPRL